MLMWNLVVKFAKHITPRKLNYSIKLLTLWNLKLSSLLISYLRAFNKVKVGQSKVLAMYSPMVNKKEF